MIVARVLAALVLGRDDPEVASLRADLVGKRIWVYGATIRCDKDRIAAWDPRDPVTVLDVRRETDRFYEAHGGKRPEGLLYHQVTPWCAANNWGPEIPWAERTIRVEVRLPQSRVLASDDSMLVGLPHRSGRDPFGRSLPTTASFNVVDRDELWRFATPVTPWTALSRTTERVRNAFTRRELAIGMPRSLAALIVADPDPGASKDEVWKRVEWDYQGGTLDSYVVVFDAEDRIANFGVNWAPWP